MHFREYNSLNFQQNHIEVKAKWHYASIAYIVKEGLN